MTIPGIRTTGYLGLKERNPPDQFFRDRDPTTSDTAGYDIGDLWINRSTSVFFRLISQQRDVGVPGLPVLSTWVPISGASSSGILTINTIFPDGAGNFSLTSSNSSLSLAPIPNGIDLTANLTLTGDVGGPQSFNGNNFNVQGGAAGALEFTSSGLGQMDARVLVDGLTVNIVGNQLVAATGLFPWIETALSLTMAVNSGYIGNDPVGPVDFQLPAIAAQGAIFRVSRKGAGQVRVVQQAGQTIFFGDQTTTPGVGGRLDSTSNRDAVEILCVTANTEFQVLSSTGNWDVI